MRETISEGYKTALKAGDKRRTATLRAVNAALKDKDIEARGQGKGPLADADVLVTQMLGDMQQAVMWETVREALGVRSEARAELVVGADRIVPITCQPIESDGKVVGALVDFGSPTAPRSSSSSS